MDQHAPAATAPVQDAVRVRHASFARMGPMAHTGSHDTPCHCVVLQAGERVVLIDTGFGLQEMRDPVNLIGRDAIAMLNPLVSESFTAVRTLERWGLDPGRVTDIVLTHLDNDHAGGLHDFPDATVHVAAEELDAYDGTRPRGPYKPYQVSHRTKFRTYAPGTADWFGLESRTVELPDGLDVRLVPLPGHTLGHCGVAYREGRRWSLLAGDAYFDRRVHLQSDDPPDIPIELTFQTDAAARRRSLREVRRLFRDHAEELDLFCTHDQSELEARGGDTTAPFAAGA